VQRLHGPPIVRRFDALRNPKCGRWGEAQCIADRRRFNWINLAFFRLNAVVSAVFLIVALAEAIFLGGFRLR
jgi:hypothetical protein